MKKLTILSYTAAAVICTASFISCQTTANVALNAYDPVAILTVYSNSQVPWDDTSNETTNVTDSKVSQSDDGVLTGSLNKLIDKKNPELLQTQSRIDDAASLLQQKFTEYGISTISNEKIRACKIYNVNGSHFMDYMGNVTPATGYDALKSSSSKLNKTIAKETGALSELYIGFRFEKQKVKDGVHDIGVRALVIMSVYGADSKGKTILAKDYTSTSTEYTPYVDKKWDREEVCSYFHDAVDAVITQFMMDYAGTAPNATATSDEETKTASAEATPTEAVDMSEAEPIAIPVKK